VSTCCFFSAAFKDLEPVYRIKWALAFVFFSFFFFVFLATCARLSWSLSFWVHIKLFFRIVPYINALMANYTTPAICVSCALETLVLTYLYRLCWTLYCVYPWLKLAAAERPTAENYKDGIDKPMGRAGRRFMNIWLSPYIYYTRCHFCRVLLAVWWTAEHGLQSYISITGFSRWLTAPLRYPLQPITAVSQSSGAWFAKLSWVSLFSFSVLVDNLPIICENFNL